MATTLGNPRSTFHWTCSTCKQLWEIKSHPPSKPSQKEKPMSHLPSQKERKANPLGCLLYSSLYSLPFLPRLMARVESMSVHRDATFQTKELSKEPHGNDKEQLYDGGNNTNLQYSRMNSHQATFLKTCYRNESKLELALFHNLILI